MIGNDQIEIVFEMAIHLRSTDPRVKATLGQVAITRGPLVFCLEDLDNPGINIFTAKIDPASLSTEFHTDLLDGTMILRGTTIDGQNLTMIPYCLWGNRGASQMTVYLHI